MHTPEDAAPLAVSYLRIIFLALPFMYFYNFVMMTLRGAGDSRTPFWFMLLSVVLDVVLNPVLIFGVGPIPPLGIAGSALATLIAQLVSLAAMMVLLYRRRHFLLLHRGQLALLRPDPAILRALVVKGLPMGLQMVVISSSAIVMMALVNAYGSQTTAAYGVASQLWTYVQMPALAVGASVSSMVAQNVGAGLWQRVSRITRVGLLINVVMTGALVALIYLFNRHSLGLFLGTDGVAIGIAQHINVVVLWSFILFGFTIVIFGTVRATGAVMAPLVILFLSMWVIRLPFAWMLGPRIGARRSGGAFRWARWCRWCWRLATTASATGAAAISCPPWRTRRKPWGRRPTPAWERPAKTRARSSRRRLRQRQSLKACADLQQRVIVSPALKAIRKTGVSSCHRWHSLPAHASPAQPEQARVFPAAPCLDASARAVLFV